MKDIDREFHLEDAMRILTETYHKILKVNLSDDTHIDIKVYESEQTEDFGYAEKISDWLREFAVSGQVYEKDRDEYLWFTDIEHWREHFAHSDECLRLHYRRLTNGVFRWVTMELLKASDYTPENQTVMLYIQDIHDSYARELETQKELETLCRYDTLTGLKNLYSFRSMCSRISGMMLSQTIGVLFADLNGLKIVNDMQGHDRGNDFICTFAEKLKRCMGAYECFRVSGDEFIVVCIGSGIEDFGADAAELVHEINLESIPTASIGWVVRDSINIEGVATEAEAKMYESKREFYKKYPEYRHNVVEVAYKKEMDELIRCLTDSYEVLLIADLDKDIYRVLKHNATSIRAGEPSSGVYSQRNDGFCDEYVSEDFRELRRRVGSIDNLKEQLRFENHIVCDYRLKNGQWRESAFWRMKDDTAAEPSKIIYYSQGIDHSMAERLNRRLEAEESFEVMAGLSETYRSVSVIDLKTGEINLRYDVNLPESIGRIFRGLYTDAMRDFAEEFVSDSERDRFIEETRLESIKMKLRNLRTINVLCSIKPEMQEAAETRYEKISFCLSRDNRRDIIMATKDITDVVEWSHEGTI